MTTIRDRVSRLHLSPWAALAFTVYVLAIVMSNYAITHYGTEGQAGHPA